MTPTDIYKHLASAYVFLLRLPLPAASPPPNLSAAALWACIPVGLVIGVGLAFIAAGLLAVGLSERLVAWIIIGVAAAVTGALHEDALADVLDGFFGGYDTDSRLAIMKDSHIGVFGVLVLVVMKSAEAELLTVILRADGGLVAFAALAGVSRGFWGLALRFVGTVGEGGLADSLGEVKDAMIIGSLLMVAVLVIISMPIMMAVALLAVLGGVCYLWAWWCRHKIGGLNGDCLGALQQCNMLIGLAIVALGGVL